jgi:hypothetical protein
MRRIGTILFAGTIVLIAGAAVRAQDAPQKPTEAAQAIKLKVEQAVAGELQQVKIQWATGGMLGAVVTGAPYSAVTTNESTQTLADGNRIVQKSTYNVARDGQGRVRREEVNESGAVTSITILDPVAKTTYVLDPVNRTAQSMPLLAGAAFKMATGTQVFSWTAQSDQGMVDAKRKVMAEQVASEKAAANVSITTSARGAAAERATAHSETLGTQLIENVPADGTRTTRTIPAGQIGNERPIDIVSEEWYSKDLQMTVMSRHADPRSGETLYRVTSIQRTEPDPGLFQIPAGYTVQDAPFKVVRDK